MRRRERVVCREHRTMLRDCGCPTPNVRVVDCPDEGYCTRIVKAHLTKFHDWSGRVGQNVVVDVLTMDFMTATLSGTISDVQADGFWLDDEFVFFLAVLKYRMDG